MELCPRTLLCINTLSSCNMKLPEKEAMVASHCRIVYYLIVKAFSRMIRKLSLKLSKQKRDLILAHLWFRVGMCNVAYCSSLF